VGVGTPAEGGRGRWWKLEDVDGEVLEKCWNGGYLESYFSSCVIVYISIFMYIYIYEYVCIYLHLYVY